MAAALLRAACGPELQAIATSLRALPSLNGLIASGLAPGLPWQPSAPPTSLLRVSLGRGAHSGRSSGWQHASDGSFEPQSRSLSGLAVPEEAEEAEEGEAAEPHYSSDAERGDWGMPTASMQLQYQPSEDARLATEGEVDFNTDGPLAQAIAQHYGSMSSEYQKRVSFDEFGERYLKQIEKEERARQRALQRLREMEGDAAGGASTSGRPDAMQARLGGIAKRLVHTWLPLLEEAIAHEQKEVGALAGARWARQGRACCGSRRNAHGAASAITWAWSLIGLFAHATGGHGGFL